MLMEDKTDLPDSEIATPYIPECYADSAQLTENTRSNTLSGSTMKFVLSELTGQTGFSGENSCT